MIHDVAKTERAGTHVRTHAYTSGAYPTLSYEVTVDHCKKIIAATQGHPGARNDKTIVKFDGFVTSINNGDLYGDVPYSLTNEDDEEIPLKGLYLIVDGGYHKWRCLQCPMKHTSKFKEGLWSGIC
jgi:hypothetical protein